MTDTKPTRRVSTRAFKLKALALAERGDTSVVQRERALGLSAGLLRYWQRRHRAAGAQAFPGTGHHTARRRSSAHLRVGLSPETYKL